MHWQFLDASLRECMLRDAVLLKLLAKLLTICVIFADALPRMRTTMISDDNDDEATMKMTMPRPTTKATPPTILPRLMRSWSSHRANPRLKTSSSVKWMCVVIIVSVSSCDMATSTCQVGPSF